MIVTLNWLNEYVDLNGLTPEQIVEAFTLSGFEIESYTNLAKGLDFVVVGRVDKIVKHPNADKLLICTIFDGEKHNQIITHATNMKVGDLVPVALTGADLPNGVKIKPTNMRGVDSCGMMCAGEELGINNSVYAGAETDGIMILNPSDCTVGEPIAKVLGFDDVVYDVKVLANRPDCQSVIGLAKELACATNRPFKGLNLNYTAKAEDLPLTVESRTENCPYIIAQVVRNIKISSSPKWLQNRLKAVGLRPLNNIIDITNYVLWETGQPMHAYDYAQIAGSKIIARQAEEGESITVLNGTTYKLKSQNMVIANESKAMGLAGIMGGEKFSISNSTKDIVLESATFKKENIRRTSRGIGLRTDASGRYERGVEPVSCETGLQRALALIEQLQIGETANKVHRSDIKKELKATFENRTIEVDYSRILTWLGVTIPENEAIAILNRLDIKTRMKGNTMICEIPPIRSDIENFSDIAEEIIRYWGLHKLPVKFNEDSKSITGGYEKSIALSNQLKEYMLLSGANEVQTFSLSAIADLDKMEVSKEDSLYKKLVYIKNPLNASTAVLRTQMFSSLLGAVKHNVNHKNTDFALFEVGKIFFNINIDVLPEEREILSYVTIEKNMDFFSVKSIVEMLAQRLGLTFSYQPTKLPYLHPNISADIILGNQKIGIIGKVHPRVATNFEINNDMYYFKLDLGLIPEKKVKKIKPLAKYPSSVRDLAIVVKRDIAVGTIIDQIKRSAGTLCESVDFFDVYTGEQVKADEKSVAVRLTFRKQDGTLTQDEINEQVNNVLLQLKVKFNAKLRE